MLTPGVNVTQASSMFLKLPTVILLQIISPDVLSCGVFSFKFPTPIRSKAEKSAFDKLFKLNSFRNSEITVVPNSLS
jgi:hypothetical protein